MGFKLKPKHVKQAWKVTCKAAPIALIAAEVVFPTSKAVQIATKAGKIFF